MKTNAPKCHPGCPRPATREYRGRWICDNHYCQQIVDTQIANPRFERDYDHEQQVAIEFATDRFQEGFQPW